MLSSLNKLPPVRQERPEPRRCERCGGMVEPVLVELPRGGKRWIEPARCRCEVEEWEREQARLTGRTPAARGWPGGAVGDVYAGSFLDSFDPVPEAATVLQRARQYLEQWATEGRLGFGLYLYGGAGTGKTRLATAILNEVARRHGIRGQAWNMKLLLQQARSLLFTDAAESHRLLGEATRAPLLLLDEVGFGLESGWELDQAYLLVDYRCANLLPTLVTSNVTLSELSERHERLASRLMEMTLVLNFKQVPDYRRKKAKDLQQQFLTSP